MKTKVYRIVVVVVALVSLCAMTLWPNPKAQALGNGDGLVMYGEGSVQTPRYRTWTNATNTLGSEASLPTAGDVIHYVQMATAPNRQEVIAAVSQGNITNQLRVYHYNGNSWTADWQVSTGFSSSAPRFDAVYDQATGKGFVVYSKDVGTTNELAYRTWDGTAWSGEVTYDAVRTSGTIAYVKALARPGSDEIAVIWADDINMDMSANYFDMSSGTWSGEPAAALSTNVARNGTGASLNSNFADLAFENVSGDLQVCWGDEGVADLICSTRTAGTGGSWGSPTTITSFTIDPVDMTMASEPGTDYIAYNNARENGTPGAEAAIWDGSAWGNINNYDNSLNSVGTSTSNVSVGWLVNGGQSRVVATYDDSLASGVDWLSFNKNTSSWSTQTDFTTAPANSNFNDLAHVMRQNPFNNAELMFLLRDSNQDLFTKKITFDGTTITWSSVEPSATSPETSLSDRNNSYAWSIDFAYYGLNNNGVIDPTGADQGTYFDGSAPAYVFTTDQVGYAFYRDRGGQCVYTKSTDGGVTWGGTPVTIAPSACFHAAVWYDRWTPGDTTGNYIHIVTVDGTVDDLKYNRLDVSSDTLLSGGTPTAITSTPGPVLTNDFISHDNYPAISKATNGTIYAGVHDSDAVGQQSYVIACSASCDTASNWSNTSAVMDEGTVTQAKNYGLLLEPLAGGNMMMIVSDATNSDVLSKVYNSGTTTWAGSWTTIDSNAGFSSVYAGIGISAVADKKTNDIYLAYTAQAASLGTDDDFRTATYNGSSWSAKTDILTNDSKGLISPQLALNENNGDIYAMYIARTTPATATTANVYWKKTTDGMTTWGSEQGPLNTRSNDLWGLRANVMSNERIYAVWSDAVAIDQEPRLVQGSTVADLTVPTYAQSGFRFFANANSTNVGSALAAQNTAATASTGGAFRLRMLLHANGDGARAGLEDFKLQYAGKGAGTCAAPSGTPSSYTDVTAATTIAYNNNATPTDASALTTNANDPTHSSDTIQAQTYEELNDFTNSITKIGGNEDGLWDFALIDNGAPVTTAYCFRVVKSSGTALTTYSQYPQITSGSGNIAPDSPTSLAQTKTDTTNLTTGSWTNQSSVRFTASASDTDASDTLQLCVEKKPLGTAFDSDAAAETCGSGVAYSGSPVSTEVTIGSHTEDQYHWQARVKDAAGSYSSWVSYGSNLESVQDYGVDTSVPTGGTIYDGTSAGVDAAFNDNSLSSLSANWAGFNANISGLNRYEYSIGTSPLATDIKGWTSVSTSTSVTATALTLQTSRAYYVNVSAIDNAGNATIVTSDGQLVLPSLSFGISSNALTFSNLNAANSYTDSKTTTLTTSTNAYGGYMVRAFATDYLRAGALSTIPDFSGGSYAAPDSWQSGDVGFGFTSSDTSVQGANIFQAGTCPGGSALAAPGCFAPFSQTAPGTIVADHTANVSGTPLTNQQFTLTYRVTTDAAQAAANNYATTVVYSVTPVY